MYLGGSVTASDAKVKVRRILCDIPSAATYGATNITGGWKKNTMFAPHVAAHRCKSGTPVVLLDPILSELYDGIVNKVYIPTPNDCIAAKELMEILSKGFDAEAREMQLVIREWAARSLGINHSSPKL